MSEKINNPFEAWWTGAFCKVVFPSTYCIQYGCKAATGFRFYGSDYLCSCQQWKRICQFVRSSFSIECTIVEYANSCPDTTGPTDMGGNYQNFCPYSIINSNICKGVCDPGFGVGTNCR